MYGMDFFDWLMVVYIFWAIVMFGTIPWLYNARSGWVEVKSLTFYTRLRLIIPFWQGWKSDIPHKDIIAVAKWRNRYQIFIWLVLILPLCGVH